MKMTLLISVIVMRYRTEIAITYVSSFSSNMKLKIQISIPGDDV